MVGCRPPSAECCGTSYYYYPATEICCADGQGACPIADACCRFECCQEIAYCGEDGFCYARNTPTRTQSPTSKPSTTKSSSLAPTLTRSQTISSASTSMTTRTYTSEYSSTTTYSACSVTVEKRTSLSTFTVPYREKYTTIPNSGGKNACLDNREVRRAST
jgi:hypothetical protein